MLKLVRLKLALNDAGAGSPQQLAKAVSLSDLLAKLTKRYSPLIDQCGDKAHSRPPPAVHPVSILREEPAKQGLAPPAILPQLKLNPPVPAPNPDPIPAGIAKVQFPLCSTSP